MHDLIFVADRGSYDSAATLIDGFGEQALAEAVARAEASRDRGNHIHYTHWCRVGRTILLISGEDRGGPRH